MHLRGTAVHEQEDYVPGFCLELRRTRAERIPMMQVGLCPSAVSRIGKKRGQGHGAEAVGALPQHLAARQRSCKVVMAMHGLLSVYENKLLDVEQDVAQIAPCLELHAARRRAPALQEFHRFG